MAPKRAGSKRKADEALGTMRAARYHPDTNKCSVDEIPIPKITEDEILVKMGSASLCHSDLMLFDGSIPATEPVVMGHEGVGFVEEVGKKVTDFKKGDRVGFLYIKGCCYECAGCQIHNLNCTNGSPKIQGFMADGMFAEYAAIDRHNAILMPDNLETSVSAPIFCAGITAFHGVDSCDLKEGQSIVIVGCGGLGQFGIRFAKAMGLKVIGLDINDDVLQEAKENGADLTLNSKDSSFSEEIKKFTDGGADAAVVYSNAQAAYDSATKTLKMGGILMVVGLPAKPIGFNALDLMKKMYQIRSESTGPPQQMPRALEFISKHEIKPKVETYKLDDIHTMIDLMQSGKSKSRMAVVF